MKSTRSGTFLALPALCCLLLMTLMAGCKAANTVIADRPNAPAEDDVRRISMNPALGINAHVESVYTGKNNDLLVVSATVLNKSGTRKVFRYQFNWFDANGLNVYDPNESYKFREIEGRERVTISGVAPTPAVTDWRLQLLPR